MNKHNTKSPNFMKAWLDKFELFIPIGMDGDGFVCSKIFGLEPNNLSDNADRLNSNLGDDWYCFVGIENRLGQAANKNDRFLQFRDSLPFGGDLLLVTILYEGEFYEMSCSFVSTYEIENNKPHYYPCNKSEEELKDLFKQAIDNCTTHHTYNNSNGPVVWSVERLRTPDYIPMYRKICSYHHYSFDGYYGEYQKCHPEKMASYHGVVCEISKKIQIFYTKEKFSRTKYDREGNLYQDHDEYDYVGELFFPTIHDMYDYIDKAKKSGLCKITMSDVVRDKHKLFDAVREDFKSNNKIKFFNPHNLPKLSMTTDFKSVHRSSFKEEGATIGNSYSITNCIRIIQIEMKSDQASIQDVFPQMVFYFDHWYYDER